MKECKTVFYLRKYTHKFNYSNLKVKLKKKYRTLKKIIIINNL